MNDKELGMALRDWFAGQALVGLMANILQYSSWKVIAEKCYQAADAMIAKANESDQ